MLLLVQPQVLADGGTTNGSPEHILRTWRLQAPLAQRQKLNLHGFNVRARIVWYRDQKEDVRREQSLLHHFVVNVLRSLVCAVAQAATTRKRTTHQCPSMTSQNQGEIPQGMREEMRIPHREERRVEVLWEELLGSAHCLLLRNLIPNHETVIPKGIWVAPLTQTVVKTSVPLTPPAVESDSVCSIKEREDLLQMEDLGTMFLSQGTRCLPR